MNTWAQPFGERDPLEESFMWRDEDESDHGRPRGLRLRLVVAGVLLAVVTACGGSPLQSIGERSSEWINEPTVPSTVSVITTAPRVVSTDRLTWANDEIETENLSDRDALLAEVFARRGGDRFIQASRAEIAAALPGVSFPGRAPNGAEWVSSQLVFNDDGSVAADPSAAFGIWSAEPYTRSRSVAQMVVLRVATDREAADEVASGESDPSCARFSDRATSECEMLEIGSRDTWLLTGSGGPTLIWFESPYRYEMSGRTFVPLPILQEMSGAMVPLDSIGGDSS